MLDNPQGFTWPLMHDNVTRADLDDLITYLSQDDPRLTHGPKVRQFEEAWAEWVGTRYSVMVNSGSSANDLTMMAIRELFGPGEVILSPLGWVSDVAAVIHAGLEPVFVDIDPVTLGPDSRQVIDHLTAATRAVLLVHVLGLNALMDSLIDACREASVPIIEDVCESHGALHAGKRCGSVGFASNFSFYYAHHLTTIEGGMVCTNDEEFADTIRMLRSHGLVRESRWQLGETSTSRTIQGSIRSLSLLFRLTTIGPQSSTGCSACVNYHVSTRASSHAEGTSHDSWQVSTHLSTAPGTTLLTVPTTPLSSSCKSPTCPCASASSTGYGTQA